MGDEPKKDLSEQDLERISSLIYIFMWQLQAGQKQQHIELVNTFAALVRYLGEEKEYKEKLEKIEYTPIQFIIALKKDLFNKEELRNFDTNYNLAELDFLYFRDTSLAYKLSKSYQSTHTKHWHMRKKIHLSQIIITLSLVRKWVFAEFLFLIKKHNLVIPKIELPQTGIHNLQGVGINQTQQVVRK